MFSIIIPTFNNLEYLKLCIKSIRQNSKFNHQIVPHVNIGSDKTSEFLVNENIDFTFTDYNSGICEGMNMASKKSKFPYILYSHDDFYFCPGWDLALKDEIEKIGHNNFYLSGIMMNNGPIKCNFGNDLKSFDEKKFLNEYKKYNHYDFQGSTWAPHLIHKEIWNRVGGFSEEFYPGTGSDPDLNMKLWQNGVRIFKGLSNFKVYHFGSISLRKKKDLIVNNGTKTFLKKWKITPKFFTKHYLRGGTFKNNRIISRNYSGPIDDPIKNFSYFFDFIKCKIKFLQILLS